MYICNPFLKKKLEKLRSLKELRKYQIAFVGLKLGEHVFDFAIDGSFFKHFEGSLISECKINVKLVFEKKETFFMLRFYIDGTVNVSCDRCMEPFDKDVFGDFECIVKYADELAKLPNDEDEIIYIAKEDSHIDVAQLIYEYISICLPMQLIHPKLDNGEEGCNPAVLAILNKKEEAPTEEDPRWSALKGLKFDNNNN